MRIEANLADHEARIVYGTKGTKGGLDARPFRRTFKNAAAMERWLDTAEDVQIDSIERA